MWFGLSSPSPLKTLKLNFRGGAAVTRFLFPSREVSTNRYLAPADECTRMTAHTCGLRQLPAMKERCTNEKIVPNYAGVGEVDRSSLLPGAPKLSNLF